MAGSLGVWSSKDLIDKIIVKHHEANASATRHLTGPSLPRSLARPTSGHDLVVSLATVAAAALGPTQLWLSFSAPAEIMKTRTRPSRS